MTTQNAPNNGNYLCFLQHTNQKREIASRLSRKLISLNKNVEIKKICDVGCGDGELLSNVLGILNWHTKPEILLIDPNPQQLKLARERLRESGFQKVKSYSRKFEKIPTAVVGNSDIILASHVVYYLNDINKQIQLLNYCLTSLGCLIIIVRQTNNNDGYHIRSLYRNHFNYSSKARNTLESITPILHELEWDFEIEPINSTVSFTEYELNEFIKSNGDLLSSDPMTKVVKFFCDDENLKIPPDLKSEIIRLFDKRVASNNAISLELSDAIIYIRKINT